MSPNAPLPFGTRPVFAEGSKLISSRDSRNNSHLWKKGQANTSQLDALMQSHQQLKRMFAKGRRKPLGGSMPSTSVKTFQIVSDGGDWYNCNTFDGVTAGGSIVKVAKNQDIRCITSTGPQAPVAPLPLGGAWYQKVIRGVTYTYTYNAVAGATTDGVNVIEYTRGVVGSDASAETDYITPCLNVGDIISAFQTSFSGPDTLKNVTWQALADGRAWAAHP